MATPSYPWSRLTCPKKTDPTRELHGWVAGPGPWQNTDVKALSKLRGQQAVVVLGERGFGKTDALAHEARALEEAGHEAELVKLADLPSTVVLERLRTALTAPPGATRYVLIDGLDDAPAAAEIDTTVALILRELDPATADGVRLRLSCRTSRWPRPLTEKLAVVFGTEPVIVHMAELTRADAVAAAREREVPDPEAFVGTLEARRLVPLATRPVTFIPLLDARAEGKLANPRPGFSPPDLVALAGRAAAALQFCAREFLSEGARVGCGRARRTCRRNRAARVGRGRGECHRREGHGVD